MAVTDVLRKGRRLVRCPRLGGSPSRVSQAEGFIKAILVKSQSQIRRGRHLCWAGGGRVKQEVDYIEELIQ